MRKTMALILAGIVLVITLAPGWSIQAAPNQQGTLALKNAGFEEGTTNGWVWWHLPETIDTDSSKSWYNPMYVPNRDSKRVHSGGQALEVNNEYRKWRGGVYQTVDAAPGTKLVFKMWVQGYMKPSGMMMARVGIDPNGGTSPDAAVWSGTASVGESYVQLVTPEVTVGASGKATVFSWAETPSPAQKTAVFLDDATVEVTGQAQAQPTTGAPPPAQPTTPPVQPITPAQPQADGSIVYSVQSGDTLFAIALAHDTTVDSIMQLNGMSDTMLSIGQRLIIRGPTVAPTAPPPPTQAVPPTAAPTAVPPTGQICIQAFNDRDGNALPGGVGEDALPGVVFALSTAQGALKNYTTDGTEPYCFADLLPDTYTIKIVPPNGYSATTPEVWSLGVTGGQKVDVNFGAKRGSAATPTATPKAGQSSGSGGGSSALGSIGRVFLGILAVIVLIGLGAGAMYFVTGRR